MEGALRGVCKWLDHVWICNRDVSSLRGVGRLTELGGNQQESCETGEIEEALEMSEEEITGADETGKSNGSISLDNREFLRKLDLELGHLAEAGAIGVLNVLLEIKGEEGTKDDVVVTEELNDSPT